MVGESSVFMCIITLKMINLHLVLLQKEQLFQDVKERMQVYILGNQLIMLHVVRFFIAIQLFNIVQVMYIG